VRLIRAKAQYISSMANTSLQAGVMDKEIRKDFSPEYII